MKRVVLISVIYALGIYLLLFCFQMFFAELPPLLPGEDLSYNLKSALLQFFYLLPAILLSAYVIGYTVMFHSSQKQVSMRFSPTIIRFFKKIMVGAICATALIIAAEEMGVPMLRRSLKKQKEAPLLYKEYMQAGKAGFQKGLHAMAYQYAAAAYNLYPESDEAQILMADSSVYFDIAAASAAFKTNTLPDLYPDVVLPNENPTTYELLLKAMVMFQNKDWINSHYYASLALAIAEEGSANQTDAKMLAAEAWNNLEEVIYNEDSVQQRFYEQKKKAYQTLMAGDIVEAYYAFNQLAARYSEDPDIVRFKEISSKKMKEQYFFFDEIPVSKVLEDAKNLCFQFSASNGSFYAVYVKGVSSVQGTGGMIQYLRDLSIYKYTRKGTFEMSLFVPYAKMIAQPLDSLSPEAMAETGVYGKNASVPLIMLAYADKEKKQPIVKPKYTFANGKGGTEPENYLILSMPYEDFNLLKKVSSNPAEMNLADLFAFASKAEKYGYAKEVYMQELANRLTMPFLFMALLIFVAVCGWNYRLLPQNQFRITWIFALPILTFAVAVFIAIGKYLLKIMLFGIADLFGMLPILIPVLGAILLLIFSCIAFLSRKS